MILAKFQFDFAPIPSSTSAVGAGDRGNCAQGAWEGAAGSVGSEGGGAEGAAKVADVCRKIRKYTASIT